MKKLAVSFAGDTAPPRPSRLCAGRKNLWSVGSTQGQLAPAIQDGNGWFIPASTLLDARLFHSPPKVAVSEKRTGLQTSVQMGQTTRKKVCKRGTVRGASRVEIKVEVPAENGQDCRTHCSKETKIYINTRIYGDFKADASDLKFDNETQAKGALGWSDGWRDGGGGGGGSDGRPDQNSLMGLREWEFQTKASRFER